jgi:glyoxylase-like metal-dependent hydrolase (beta-lactamase superfamily II)
VNAVALHAFNQGDGGDAMTGGGNWTWLIRGRVPTLVDAGTGDPRHILALESALAGAPLAQVLVTHGHPDHASGASAIGDRMSAVRFLKMPWPAHDDRWGVQWARVVDGETIPAGDAVVTAVHTPGHAPDHCCFWHAESRTLFGGDLVIAGTTVFIPPSPNGDLDAYLHSLERIVALEPARILPAHGPEIDDPLALLRSYIAHRRERETQIVEALRRGETHVEGIVSRIYTDLRRDLLPRARDTVIAHLQKLERGGRAARRDDAWHIIEP